MSLEPRRESSCGHHYVTTYQNCPRNFYFKYILGFMPSEVAVPLVFGSAYHIAREARAKGASFEEALVSGNEEIYSRASTLPPYTDVEGLIDDLRKMFTQTELLFEETQQHYNYVAIEKELLVRLSNGFKMTIRADAIVQAKASGDVFILEYKTTRSSLNGMFRSVANGDQATAYVLGARRCAEELGVKPEQVIGVLPEVAYLKGSQCTAARGDPIMPTQYELDAYEARIIGVLSEIGEKLSRLQRGFPSEALFPRACTLCTGFFKCPYENICKRFWDGTFVPEGFTKDPEITPPSKEALR
jgi:RecB family exonuclease